jgi:hypothetical protein
MAQAEEILNYRVVAGNGVLVLKIFRIEPDAERPCGYHYSLAYIPFWIEDKNQKQNYLRYDNAHDGPHKHKKGERLPYVFKDPKTLLSDFLSELLEMLKEDNQPFEEIAELLEELKEVEL